MVLEFSVEPMKGPPDNIYSHDSYTVQTDYNRILTVVTHCDKTISKWVEQVLKRVTNSKLGILIVGVSVERENLVVTRDGARESPFELLKLCIGSNCILYHLSDPNYYITPKPLQKFFDNPRVIAVGMQMEYVADKLEHIHGIKIKNPMDLRSLAMKGLKREDLDLGRYTLNCLNKVVLGKHMDVEMPVKKMEWFEPKLFWHGKLTMDKVGYSTIDAYICFRIGSVLLEMIDDSANSSKKMKKKKKKNQLIIENYSNFK